MKGNIIFSRFNWNGQQRSIVYSNDILNFTWENIFNFLSSKLNIPTSIIQLNVNNCRIKFNNLNKTQPFKFEHFTNLNEKGDFIPIDVVFKPPNYTLKNSNYHY